MGKAGLKLNLDKSAFTIMGPKKSRKKLQSIVDSDPLTLYNRPMKQVKVLKYLGENITTNLEESIHETVKRRAAVARHSIYEIRTVVEDIRAGAVGSLGLAIDLWSNGVLPMILYNSECFIGLSKRTVKLLDGLFHFFCQIVFKISISC